MHSHIHYVSKETIRLIVYETCQAIYCRLHSTVFPPRTPEKWIQTANEFETSFGIPNVIGAIDGKFIEIQKPDNSGPLYYSWRGI